MDGGRVVTSILVIVIMEMWIPLPDPPSFQMCQLITGPQSTRVRQEKEIKKKQEEFRDNFLELHERAVIY